MSRPDEKTRKRLRRAVEYVERQPTDLNGPARKQADGRPGFYAEITGDQSAAVSGPVGYSWKRLQLDAAGGLEDDPDTITGTGTAFEINDATGIPIGARAWFRFAGFVDDGSGTDVPAYLFTIGHADKFDAILGTATVLADNRWAYPFSLAKYDKAGKYTTVPGGLTGTAYNDIEQGNTATGVQGCGINVDNLPTGWAIKPIGAGAKVEITAKVNCDTLATEYTFEGYNNADGTCP